MSAPLGRIDDSSPTAEDWKMRPSAGARHVFRAICGRDGTPLSGQMWLDLADAEAEAAAHPGPARVQEAVLSRWRLHLPEDPR